jgi:glutaminase
MVNSGAIMSAALLLYMVKPEMSVSEKFEYVQQFFTRMAGGEHVGFQNSVFLSERDTADREAFSIYNQINILLPIRILIPFML